MLNMDTFIAMNAFEIASDSRRQYLTVKSLSTESAKSSASSRGSDTSPGHKSFGGCYSATKTGGKDERSTLVYIFITQSMVSIIIYFILKL